MITRATLSTIEQGLPKYRSMLAGNTAFSPSSFDSIASVSLSGTASDITFSSIPQTYTHLQLRLMARSTGTGGGSVDTLYQLNGDTTASNYRTHLIYGDGTSAAGVDNTNVAYITDIANASTTTGIFGVAVVDFLDYTNTNKYKVSRSIGGFDANNSAANYLLSISSLWLNTAAITSIKLYINGNSFAQYSHAALYGIRVV